MTALALRTDLIAGPHPTDTKLWLVYDEVSGRQFEIPEEGWHLAEDFDGERSIAAIARRRALTEAVVEGFAARLEGMGLLAPYAPGELSSGAPAQWSRGPIPDGFTIAAHPEARFVCEGAGTCCERGYVIPLTVEQTAAVRRAGLRVLGPDVDPIGLVPTTPGRPWSYALDNAATCPFLDEAKRCRIHGASAYPDACRIFPFVFARWGATIHASVTHRCVCGARGLGPTLTSQRAALVSRVERSASVFTVPEVTRIDGSSERPSGTVVAALHDATTRSGAFSILRAAASSLSDHVGAAIPNETLFAEVAARCPDDPFLVAATSGEPHPDAPALRRAMRATGLGGRASEAAGEADRFVRDYLYGLRPYHYATIAGGLLAVAMAAHRILTKLPRRGAHPVARERVLTWEEALTTDALPRVMASFPLAGDIASVAGQIDALDPGRAT